MYIKINDKRRQAGDFSDVAGKNTPGAIKVDCGSPTKFHKLKNDYQDFSGAEQWEADSSQKQELIAVLAAAVDKRTAATLAAGLDFSGGNFPLVGDAYADNMAAAIAYTIGQGSGGLDLNTSDGSYAHVDDIPALISAGALLVTALKKGAIDEKAALQNKTTAELIELLNT